MVSVMSNSKDNRSQEQHMDDFQGMKGPAAILLTILEDDAQLQLLQYTDSSVALTLNNIVVTSWQPHQEKECLAALHQILSDCGQLRIVSLTSAKKEHPSAPRRHTTDHAEDPPKAEVGFEPTNNGFAIRPLSPLGYSANIFCRRTTNPTISR